MFFWSDTYYPIWDGKYLRVPFSTVLLLGIKDFSYRPISKDESPIKYGESTGLA